jgi:hypothetical protein
MTTSILIRCKPKSLTAQIRDAERKVLIRQRGFDDRAAMLTRKIHQQMTKPVTLLLASGIGFILGELTQCQNPKSHSATDEPRAAETTPLRTTLNFMTFAHTLYTALPLVWMMESFKQPGTSDQVDNQQVQPVTAASVKNK